MRPERWRRVDAVFQSALDRSGAERDAFLAAECAGDADLRREVDRLLSADRQADGILSEPAVAAAASFLDAPDDGLATGAFVSRYRVVGRIGSGGMGDVYRAEDVASGRAVALKLLPASYAEDARLRGRFLREARIASALDHPNVCAIHEVGRSDGRLFIAMELVDGETVKRLVAGGPLALPDALAIAAQTADAIAAAHERGVVHRDVKSGNVMVERGGRVVVLDFGLAKNLDASASALTRPGAVLGTPAYMAPEQARGEPADRRGDVFSLGVVMYETLAGRLPFERASEAETLAAVVRDPHPPLDRVAPGLPPAVVAVVDRALAKRPADRFASMAAMRDAVLDAGLSRP